MFSEPLFLQLKLISVAVREAKWPELLWRMSHIDISFTKSYPSTCRWPNQRRVCKFPFERHQDRLHDGVHGLKNSRAARQAGPVWNFVTWRNCEFLVTTFFSRPCFFSQIKISFCLQHVLFLFCSSLSLLFKLFLCIFNWNSAREGVTLLCNLFRVEKRKIFRFWKCVGSENCNGFHEQTKKWS